MAKPLWKFLEDGGIGACLEYGKIDLIRENANCCSWATGDLLHYHERITPLNCFCGQFNNTNNITYLSSESLNARLAANMLATGAKFLGLGEKVPTAPNGCYIAAAFTRGEAGNEYHFIRNHKCGAWTERKKKCLEVSVAAERAEYVHDLVEVLDYSFSSFNGWFAVPDHGMQNGADQAVAQVLESLTPARKSKMPKGIAGYAEALVNFYKEKNNLLNKVADLGQLESDFESLANSLPLGDTSILFRFIEKHNEIKFPQIMNSPRRSLATLAR